MPPDARTLAEEGVVIPPMHLVRGGRADWDGDAARPARRTAFPSRAVEDNLADLRAPSRRTTGRGAAARLARAHGAPPSPGTWTRSAPRRAPGPRGARRLPAAHAPPRSGSTTGRRCASASRCGGAAAATIDFAGSAGVHPGNLNATPAIVRSVVLYVLRLLVREPLPLNEGLLEPVELRIPGDAEPAVRRRPAAAKRRRWWAATSR
jgi:5-oxoprolinase (ATP-hydrolysing)